MPLRIQCNNCGKLLVLGPGAGVTIICPACGSVQRAPVYDYVEDVRPTPPVNPQLFYNYNAPTARPTLPPPTPPKPQKHNWWVTAGVAAGVVGVFLIGLLIARNWNTTPPPPQTIVSQPPSDETAWESQNRDKIVATSNQADALAINHKLTDAYAAYRDLQELVAGRTIVDPDLALCVRDAAAHQESIYEKLINGDEGLAAEPETRPDTGNTAEVQTSATPPETPSPPLPPIPTATVPPPTIPTPTPQAPQTQPISATASKPQVHNYQPGDLATDADVGSAIGRGVDFLLAHMHNGEIDDGLPPMSAEHAEQDAMAVYALLCASQAIDDPRLDIKGPVMSGAIEHLKRLPLNTDPQLIQAPVTSGRSLRARALAIYNRPEDSAALAEDVAWLVHAEINGAYTYDDRLTGAGDSNTPTPDGQAIQVTPHSVLQHLPPPVFGRDMPGGAAPEAAPALPEIWDNSNSYDGALGVAAGTDAGVAISPDFWRDVQRHWSDCQLDDGSWSYTSDQQTGTMQMTSAGVAAEQSAQNFLDAATIGERINIPPYSGPLANGLAWLAQGDNSVDVYNPRTVYLGYNLESVEQAGLATGFKYLGRHDWYGELAAQAIATQWPAGSWGRKDSGIGAFVDTSYIVTFLSRGRHPVMMTKLQFGPVWDNRPRDSANLATYASSVLGRPLNWETVACDQDWTAWSDAPILYIASHRFPQLKPEDEAKLRTFVEGGGILFTNADAADASFDSWVKDLAKRLFPQYAMTDLPAESPLYNLEEKATGRLPPLKGVSNGVRLLMVHAPSDVALAWQDQSEKTKSAEFAVGLNLYVYADAGTTSQDQQFRNRLASPCIAAPAANPNAVHLGVARIKYDGQWDPEPGAWRRMSRLFDSETNFSVDVTPVDFSGLDASAYPFATLTGVGAYEFSDADAAAVKNYVDHGGTLLIDACGGSKACGGPADFAASVETELLPKAFAGQTPRPLTAGSPLLNAAVRGMVDLTSPRLRPFAADQPNTGGFRLMEITSGQGRLIYSPLDVTSGLLGTHTWGIAGYDPAYATAVAQNLLFWAASHRGM